MVVPADHDPDEAEAANVLRLFRIACRDREQTPSGSSSVLALQPLRCVASITLGMRGDHALDRLERAAASGHRDLKTAVNRLCRGIRVQRDLVHVDKMLAQRFEIDLGPVGLGIGFENADNLLNGAEGVLARRVASTGEALMPCLCIIWWGRTCADPLRAAGFCCPGRRRGGAERLWR